MSIQNIKDSKVLQKYCKKLDRKGMYDKALELAKEMLDEEKTPQEVMSLVGMMKGLAIGSKCNGYWNEKVEHGYQIFIDRAEWETKEDKGVC